MSLEKQIKKLNRFIAKAKLQGELQEYSLIHLEAYPDALVLMEYLSDRNFSIPKRTRIVYTEKKSKAIVEHKKAMKEGIKIVTVVDMDYDYDENEINEVENIFTTKCACTLITMQFQETIGGGMMLQVLDKGLFFEFLNKYPRLNKEEVLNQVVKSTFQRLNRGFNYGKKNKKDFRKNERKLRKEGITEPINDHELITIIANHLKPDASKSVLKQCEKNVRKELVNSALKDQNESIYWLTSKVINCFTT